MQSKERASMESNIVIAIRSNPQIFELIQRRVQLIEGNATEEASYNLTNVSSVAELSKFLKRQDIAIAIIDAEMFSEARALDLLAKPGDRQAPLLLVWVRQREEASSELLGQLVECGGMLAQFNESTPELVDVYLTFANNMLRQRERRTERLELIAQRMGGDLASVFSSVLDSLAEGVGCSDRDGQLIYANPAFEEITGWSFDEIKGKRVYDFWFPKDAPQLEHEISAQEERYQHRIHGKTEDYELQISRKDGERRIIEVHAAPLRNSSGSIVGSIGVVSDITQRKSLEAQLLWSQKLEAVGRLAGSVAHDFNNLLTVISGYSTMILKRLAKSDPTHRQISAIQQASEIASALTNQLLTLSRRQVVESSLMDLNDSLVAVTDLIRGLLGTRISLELSVGSTPQNIRFDRGQLEQVILNLCVNARDAMPNGGNLKISTGSRIIAEGEGQSELLSPGKYYTLEVRDTGIGMDEQVKTRLFEPFFTTKEGGSGLGLSTVYSVVRQHGGCVTVDSELGRGSVFTVYFPAIVVLLPKEDETPKQTTASDEIGQGKVVLVVEDEFAVRELVVDILQDAGYRVIAAEDAFQAIELLSSEEQPPSLLLTDIVMPGMDGIELAGVVAKRFPNLPILAMSGCSHEAIVNEKILHSTIPFIAKPFDPSSLLEKIEEVLLAGPVIEANQKQANS